MRTALLLLLLCVWPACGWAQQNTLLAVFPHPDDEGAIGEVLVRYAALGDRVQVIVATDGKGGTRVSQLPSGDALGALRQEESRCAAKAIGIAPPIFLGIERLDTQIGTGKYFAEHKRLMALLKEQIAAIDPDVIITFGPDGDSSHAEHIVAGASVTALLLREGWVDKYPLYYLAWTQQQAEPFKLVHVHPDYFNVRIAYTQDEEDQALAMMPCYVTQFTPAEMAEDRASKLAERSNVLHFRRFVTSDGLRDGF